MAKIKVPKRVAGVKIPKAVRKGPVMDFVNSKAGRILVAQALTAAIGVLAYKQVSAETRERVRGKLKNGADETSETLKRNTARLSSAFGEAISAFRNALGKPAGEPDADSAARALANKLDEVKERVGKKKKQLSSPPSEPPSHH